MRRTALLVLAIALGVAACGQSSSQTTDNPVRGTPANITLPKVEVQNSDTGEKVQFSSLLPAEKPVLFWFWAPH